jgi:dipeptidyl aminopeptidase/acylaminoacyl peptidase
MFARTILWTLVGVSGPCSIALGDTAARAFDIDDSLKVRRILEQPRVTPDGSAIAYLLGDWQDDSSILAHKPLGQLLVHTPEDGRTVALAGHASDPVWARSGKAVAFFEGLATARELVVAEFPPGGDEAARFPTPGERSRYSARHFAPIWSDDDRYLVIAEARLQRERAPTAEPWTVSSRTAKPPLDAHFRDDTLWRLIRIDPISRERAIISPDIALREVHPSPNGERLLLGVARTDTPGHFVGDTYVQPMQYLVLSVADGESHPLTMDGATSLLGWREDAAVVAKTADGIVVVGANSGNTDVIRATSLPSATGFALSGQLLAMWGPAQSEERDAFVIPPPAPDELVIVDTMNGKRNKIIGIGDNREILQSLWLQSDNRLLVHARRLDTLAEQILLWTGGELELLLETRSAIGPIAASDAGGLLAFSAETTVAPPELLVLGLDDRQVKPISRHNEQFANVDLVSPRLVSGDSGDGQPWRALLYLPRTDTAEGSKALVVRAYGRQTDQRYQFNAEAQMHVARGYAYLLPDVFPRRGALRKAYANTLPAAVDKVRRDFVPGRMTGYLGGSLGGYAGLILLTETGVADAAVLRAAPAEFSLSWATGKDRDADLLEYLMLGDRPDQNPRAYHEDSPFWRAARITAPTLFLHGSDDQQVPLSHSQWMFQSLRRLGNAPTELRVYPGADHKIIRGSRAHYIDFYQQIFAWWERYLEPERR